MLVAYDDQGRMVEAARDLPGAEFVCPTCQWPVLLKRGRVKVAHFAHVPGADCWSEPESVTHLRAKQLLAARFRAAGYTVRLEEVHRAQRRRVDVAVTVPAATGRFRVAVEVQDSAIAVEDMKTRTRVDRGLGFLATMWVFTDRRARVLLELAQADREQLLEARVAREYLWVDNRYGQGLFVLDVDDEAVWNVRLSEVLSRDSTDQDGGYHSYTPRTLKYLSCRPASFALTCRRGRYPREWAVIFAPPTR